MPNRLFAWLRRHVPMDRVSLADHMRRMAGAYLVLVVALLLTGLAWFYVRHTVEAQERVRFEDTVGETQLAIARRMDAYIDAMRGARALFATERSVDRQKWDAFIQASDIAHRYPGIQAIAYSPRVLSQEHDVHIAAMRSQGYPGYMLKTTQKQADAFPLVYIQPFVGPNQTLLGRDLANEQGYNAALTAAADSGLPHASEKDDVEGQGGASPPAGFIVCLPVYRNGQVPTTIADRREALQGFVITVFRADDLLKGIFGGIVDPTIDFEVFDGPKLTPAHLLHDDDGALHAIEHAPQAHFRQLTTLEVGGRTWSLFFTTRRSFDSAFKFSIPLLVLLGGLGFTLLLFATTWRQATSRAAALRARAEVVTVNKGLEAFSYSVVHDLRAPLRHINRFSEMLVEDYAGQLDGEGNEYLQTIQVASRRMSQFIDGLLTLSRMTQGPVRRSLVNLSDQATMIVAELQEATPERQVEVTIAEGVMAEGDEVLLSVVLQNLLANAWKFTEQHAHAHIEFGVCNEQSKLVYFVRDDGAGFDMAYIEKLFVVFQRLHHETEFTGNGIGLATAQRIIQRHGGRIWAESQVENGAIFYFTVGNEPRNGRSKPLGQPKRNRNDHDHRSRTIRTSGL